MSMEMLPQPDPFHLATLGLFDGPIGMATLGFITEVEERPLSGFAELKADGIVGFVAEERLWSVVASVGGERAFIDEEVLFGLVTSQEGMGAIVEAPFLGALVEGDGEMVAVVEEDGLGALIVDDGEFSAELENRDPSGLVTDAEGMVAVVEEAPSDDGRSE